jgi:hypothetical protein
VYAATTAGIFKSLNGGGLWSESDCRLRPHEVLSLAFDPTNSQTVYASTYLQGVFKSTNGAGSWTRISNGLPRWVNVNALAIDPSNPLSIMQQQLMGCTSRRTAVEPGIMQ